MTTRPEGRLRGVLVGYGVIGRGHLRGYRQSSLLGIDVIADCAADRRGVAAADGYRRVYASLGEALANERIDFVDICTPPTSHLDLITASLERDLLVLCEKPLVASLSEIDRLQAALLQSGGVLYPCHNYQFAPALREMKAALRRAVTPIKSGIFRIVRTGHARGADGWKPDWRRDPAIGAGGILRDHGPHCVYLAKHLVGQPITAVACTLRYPDGGRWESTEEAALLDLYFGEIVVSAEMTWAGCRRSTSYELTLEDGSVRLEDDIVTASSSGTVNTKVVPSDFNDPSHASWFASLFEDFVEIAKDPVAVRQLQVEAMETVRVIEAAYESAARDGAVVALDSESKLELDSSQ
jgi:predicted dehydrogenase